MMKESWKSVGLGGALIVLLTLVAYIPAMHGGFVWDDGLLISENRMVRASDGLFRFWFTTEAPDYYPLAWSLWWLEWRLWGDSTTGYHVVNVLLHAVNAILVWIILQRLKIPGAWLAGLVFAVHPVNVATVAWISEQKNTLSMLFYAVAILLYLRFDEEGRWRWYGLSLAAFLLALFSKSAVLMLPVVLLGCVWWTRGKVRWKDFLCSGPFFVLSLVMGLVTIWFQYHQVLGGYTIRAASFPSRLAAAGWVPWFYLYKALLPLNLTVIYPKWEIDASRWFSYLPGIILVGCLIVFRWRYKTWGRPLLFGLGYFVVMLFPVLGFFDQGFYQFSLVADHWQYYSIVGAIALSVAAGERICRRIGEQRRCLGTVAGVAVLMVLAVATWRRGRVYADEETLWRDNVAKNPNAWLAHHNLGIALGQAGRIQEAIGHWEQALRIKPDYARTHYNLGIALGQVGKLADAIVHYEQALRIKPDFAEAHNSLGAALWQAGRIQEAIGHYEQALRIKPDFAEAHDNLGAALGQAGRIQEAIGHYEEALVIKPDYAEAHNNLGAALGQAGKLEDAIGHYQQALRIKPGFAEAHYNMGNALAGQGRISEAMAEYRETLRLKPDWPPALGKLAWILATDGNASFRNGGEAVQLAERLCVVTDYQQADAMMVLAAAYAEGGRFGDAVQVAQKALELARTNGQQELAAQAQGQLKLYQDGHPFRERSAAPPPP
ncbi:MAG: tetratricopeptide repeat protein [Verrucomicrobiia bacterium]